jgi:hypothetical protein
VLLGRGGTARNNRARLGDDEGVIVRGAKEILVALCFALFNAASLGIDLPFVVLVSDRYYATPGLLSNSDIFLSINNAALNSRCATGKCQDCKQRRPHAFHKASPDLRIKEQLDYKSIDGSWSRSRKTSLFILAELSGRVLNL